jgi:GcrA cell cycle regulator
MSWTDERVDQLKSLWAEGLSASQIARVLGGVTRNAVISKVHRLGLAGRATTVRTKPQRISLTRCPLSYGPPLMPADWIAEPEPALAEDGAFMSVLTISDRTCRWPIGDPCDSDFHYCGRKPKEGKPYCEIHARRAYQPQPNVQRGRGRLATSDAP